MYSQWSWKFKPTPGRSTSGLTPALRSFSGSPTEGQQCHWFERQRSSIPMPDRCRMRGELSVPPLTMTVLRALYTLDCCSLGWSGLVGTTLTPAARSPSSKTLSQISTGTPRYRPSFDLLLHLGVANQVKVLVVGSSGVDVCMGAV